MNSSLDDNSYFIFSTELLPENINESFRLFDSGRYKHATSYLDSLAEESGFVLVEHHFCPLRKENGKDVNGCITVLKKSGR